ncbi:MAG: hypothetical protein H0U49_01335, partial [Parachlamydiaceae bacterium]|nr:hypothetical protein [Parachlamydiaceae bacterium]
MPELRPALAEVLKRYTQAPSAIELRHIMNGYRAYRQQHILTGRVVDPSQWMASRAANVHVEQTALKTETALLPQSKVATLSQLQNAAQQLHLSSQKLRACSAIEYLRPKNPTTPHALYQLRQEIKLLQNSLRESMGMISETASLQDWIDWNQGTEKQCYEVKELEKRVAEKMQAYQEAAALSGVSGKHSLDNYGNKHKNNIEQGELVSALDLQGVTVPLSQGLSSQQVQHFLQSVAPEIFVHWQQLAVLHASYNEAAPFLENPEAAAHLKAIQDNIEVAFAKAGSDEQAFAMLGLSKEIQTWLSEMAKQGAYLMVRSTGAEDSRKHANAGGNESPCYVVPIQAAFCKAIGVVVRSYFGAGSLQNRLNADLNPFKEKLKLAVTSQELIGEPIGGTEDPKQIPISLVLFSNEPLYIGNEKFRVMRISATYGHGEGVVGNKGIASDTALILQSASQPDQLYVLYDNQLKPTRLAPVRDQTGKITLEKIPNCDEMAQRPALSNELIQRLYEWGVIGEKFFDDFPTDMEIVIKGNKIYPVQARPINRPMLLPTYLDLKKIALATSTPITQTLRGEMVVPGLASVVKIEQPTEILLADTLEKAEKLFVKGQHKLVVVAESEPANSHPVVNFSNLGIPCLYAKDFAKMQDLVASLDETHQLAVCMQSATLSLWETSKGAIDEFTSRGFVVHPAKVAISLPLSTTVLTQAGIDADIPQDLQDLLLQISSTTQASVALGQLKALQEHAWIKTFHTRHLELELQLSNDPRLEKSLRPLISAATALKEKLTKAFVEVQALIEKHPSEGPLELLLHIKVLETLLFQKPSSNGALAQHSILSLQDSFMAADALIAYQKQLSHPAYFAELLLDGSQSPIDKVYESWMNFLLKLEPIAHRTLQGESTGLSATEIAKFKALLYTLRKGDVLPIFTTFIFSPLHSKDPIEILRTLIQAMPSGEEPLIENLTLQKQAIHQLKDDLSKFGDCKTFSDAFERLQKLAANFHPDTHPWLQKEQWDALSLITRSMSLRTMNELVDLYDLSIKAILVSSSQYQDKAEQTKQFKKMLGPYLQLLKGWAGSTVGTHGFATHQDWPLPKYLDMIEAIFKELPDSDPNQMNLTNFTVSGGTLGAGTLFDRDLPSSLHDVFSLIHQNLMATTSALTKELFPVDQINASQLPENLKLALSNTEKIGGFRVGQPQLIGIEVNHKEIVFHYNVPLRSHSGKFIIRYNRHTEKLSMQSLFLGPARDRWEQNKEIVTILDAVGLLPLLSKPKFSAFDFTYTSDITDPRHQETAFKEYKVLAELSLAFSVDGMISDFVSNIEGTGQLHEKALFIIIEASNTVFGRALKGAIFDDMLNRSSNEIVAFLQLLCKNPSERAQLTAMDLVKKLAENSKVLPVVIAKAQEWSKSSNWQLRKTALDVLLRLIENGNGLSEASIIVSRLINDPDRTVSYIALTLQWGLDRAYRISEAITIAQEQSTNSDVMVRLEALDQLIQLFDRKRGHGISEACTIAQRLIKDPEMDVRIKALELLIQLVRNGQGIPEAIAAIQVLSTDSAQGVRNQVLILARQLIYQGQGISEAIAIALEWSKDSHHNSRYNAIVLSGAIVMSSGLINLDQGFPEAYTIFHRLSYDPDIDIRHTALVQLISLLNQGYMSNVKDQSYAIAELITLAQERSNDFEYKTRELAIILIKKLINEGFGTSEACHIAQMLSKDVDKDMQVKALELLRELVGKDQGISAAIIIAQERSTDSDRNVRHAALELFHRLVEEGHGITEAIAVAQERSSDSDIRTKELALILIGKVINQGHGMSVACNIAQMLSKDAYINIRLGVFDLLKELVDNDQGISTAITVAQELSTDDNSDIRLAAVHLFQRLVDKGHGITEAIAVAQER